MLYTLQSNFLIDQPITVKANSDEESNWSWGSTLGIVVGVGTVIIGAALCATGFGAIAGSGLIAAGAGAVSAVGVGAAVTVGGVAIGIASTRNFVENLSGDFDLPFIYYTPYMIFSNSIPIFDINFFSAEDNNVKTIKSNTGQSDEEYEIVSESSAWILRPLVSSWYYALRNVAIVALLSILVYVGIRMIISSASKDKAKYKQMFFDWLIAMCLVISMHYIMIFIVNISESISKIFNNQCTENIVVNLPTDTTIDGETLQVGEGAEYPQWICSFTGYARLIAKGYRESNPMQSVEFTIIYIVMVIYTLIFTVIYLKRVLYMAFLTMIAPLVAITYPIDKMNDGNAQGFNMWLREYVFNALLQPLHLLIYTILIGSVLSLAEKYPVYALVALGFMIPAEKMIRSMFGFEKASSPTTMGAMGAATTGLLMSGINRLMHKPKKIHNNENNGSNEKDNKIKMKGDKFNTLETYASENSEEQEGIASGIGGNSEGEERNLPSRDDGNNSIDYERANTFRNYRRQGLSQEEAQERINQELPFGRNNNFENVDYERANAFRNYRQQGLSQEEAQERIDQELPFSRNNNLENVDYERANIFRNYREQGLTQEEALARLNQDNNAENIEEHNSNSNLNPMLTMERRENNHQEESNPLRRSNYQNNVGVPRHRQLAGNNTQNTKPKRSIRNRVGNGMLAVGERYQNKLKKSHPVRALRRGITYGIGAATLGIIGLSAGIASGDLGKTGQYTLAAGAIGGNIGKGIGNKIASEGNQNIETFKQGWYGEEYEDKLREKKIKELQTDPNNVQYLRARDENYREILKDAYPEYARNGCYEIEDFYAAYQLEKAGMSRRRAISTYKLAQRTGDITSSPDAENKWQNRLNIEFANTEEVNKMCETEYGRIEKQYKDEEARIQEEYEKQYRKIMYASNKSDEYRKIEEKQKQEETKMNEQYEKQYQKILKNAELERERKIKELEDEYKSKIDKLSNNHSREKIAKEYEQKKKKITIENTNERKKKHQELQEKFGIKMNKLEDKYKKEVENIELEPIDKEKLSSLKKQKNDRFKEMQEKRKEDEERVKEIPIHFSKSALEDVKMFYNNKE